MQLNSESYPKENNGDDTSQDNQNAIQKYESKIETIYKNDIVDIIDLKDTSRLESPAIKTVDNSGIPLYYKHFEVDPEMLAKNENGMIPIVYQGYQQLEMIIFEGKIYIIDSKKPQKMELDFMQDQVVPYSDRSGEQIGPISPWNWGTFQGGDNQLDRQLETMIKALNNADQTKRNEAKYELSQILKDYESLRNGVYKPDDGTSSSYLPPIVELKQNISLFGLDGADQNLSGSFQNVAIIVISFLVILIGLVMKIVEKDKKLMQLMEEKKEQQQLTLTSQNSERYESSSDVQQKSESTIIINNKNFEDAAIDKKFSKSPQQRRNLNRLQMVNSSIEDSDSYFKQENLGTSNYENSSKSPPETPHTTIKKDSELHNNLSECLSPEPNEEQRQDCKSDNIFGLQNIHNIRERINSQNHELPMNLLGDKKLQAGQYTSRNGSFNNECNSIKMTENRSAKEIILGEESIFNEMRETSRIQDSRGGGSLTSNSESIETQNKVIPFVDDKKRVQAFKFEVDTRNNDHYTKPVIDMVQKAVQKPGLVQVSVKQYDDKEVELNITKRIPNCQYQSMVNNHGPEQLQLGYQNTESEQFLTPRGEVCSPDRYPISGVKMLPMIEYRQSEPFEENEKEKKELKRIPTIEVSDTSSASSSSSSSTSSEADSSAISGSNSSLSESTEQQTDQTSSLNSQDLRMSVNIGSFNNGKFQNTPNRNEEENPFGGCQGEEDELRPIHESARSISEISDESPLQNILDSGRFKKKFKNIEKIGEGGFGQVFKATYNVDQRQYAIKVVRLHIQKSKKIDPMVEIYQHRVYRELQAASRITSENIVRYFNSWFEELDEEDKQKELKYKSEYKKHLKKKNKPINTKLSKSKKSKLLRKSLKKFSFGKKEKKETIVAKSLYARENNQNIIQEESEGDESENSKANHRSAVMEEKKMEFTRYQEKSNHTLSSSGDHTLEVNQRGRRSKSHQKNKSELMNQEKTKRSVSANMRSKVSSDKSYSSSEEDEDEESISELSKGSSEFSTYTINSYLEKGQDFQSVNMMIQMEYCSGQSLENFLNKRNSKQGLVIDREQNLQIFTQVIHGMQDIHQNDVLHRDLKPENIFIDFQHNDCEMVIAKIGDFGLARMLTSGRIESSNEIQSMSTEPSQSRARNGDQSPEARKTKLGTTRSKFSSVAGTEVYMAPEIKEHYHLGTRPMKHKDVEINKRQDIYQLGLILYELCQRIKSFHQKVKLFKQLRHERTLDENCPIKKGRDIEYDLIMEMTSEKPEDRPSASEILSKWIPQWKSQLEQEALQE